MLNHACLYSCPGNNNVSIKKADHLSVISLYIITLQRADYLAAGASWLAGAAGAGAAAGGGGADAPECVRVRVR